MLISGIVLLPVGILIVGHTDSFKENYCNFIISLSQPSSLSIKMRKVFETAQTKVPNASSSESSSSIICGEESSCVALNLGAVTFPLV